MEYTLIDMQGSTLDVFEDLPTARRAIDALLKEDSASAHEFIVLTYAQGERVGAPIAARDFVASGKDYLAQVIASYLEDWTPEIYLTFSPAINASADLEIRWEAEEREPEAEMLVQRPRLALC
jgi:hypothetical protein